MKTYLRCALLGGLLLVACRAHAITPAWSYQEDVAAFYQVVADGSGGCAVLCTTTNGTFQVLRLDKKGAVVYRYPIAGSSLGFVAVGKKRMVFSELAAPPYRLIYADAKGQSIVVGSPGYNLIGSMAATYRNVLADKKGFFAIELPVAPGQPKLVRYLSK